MPSLPLSTIGSDVAAPPGAGCLGDFAVQIGFDAQRAVVGVRGELDMLTAPTLGALLTGLVDQGHPDIVLDLAALSFMGAAGLNVIATTASRLRKSDGALTVRSAPTQTRRILDITGISELIQIEMPDPSAASDDTPAAAGGSGDLRSDLARAASLPARNEIVDAALRLVVALTTATLEGADGVSVTLERNGRLTTVAASNDTILQMDGHQYDTGEGPCLAAAAEGRGFHIESLAEESRWPAFVPLAMDEGIASILSTPLIAADRPVGALNIYSNTERAFGTQQQELAAVFATQASGIVAGDGSNVTDEQMGTRIADGLGSRAVLAQAQGVLMTREGITAEVAAATLHRSARAAGTSVLEHATDVVASTRAGVGQDA